MPDLTAADLERILAEIAEHPRSAEVIEAVRRMVPTSHVDQLQAASADARMVVERVAADAGATPVARHRNDLPDWVRLGALDAILGWHTGRGERCQHRPTPDRPEPVVAAAWRPGLVVCRRCMGVLREAGVKDLTCDGCGRVCDPGMIRSGMLQAGPMVWAYGICRDCEAGR